MTPIELLDEQIKDVSWHLNYHQKQTEKYLTTLNALNIMKNIMEKETQIETA